MAILLKSLVISFYIFIHIKYNLARATNIHQIKLEEINNHSD